jgi:signal transduction histidine kinase
LRALGEVSRAVAASLDLEQVLTTIVARAVELSGADAGSIYEYDEAAAEFQLRASHGMSDEIVLAIRAARIRAGESVVGEATARRAPVQVPDVQNAPGYPLGQVLAAAGFHALLALPLLHEERIIGALVVRRRLAGVFESDTVDLLQTFASHSALAIENARLFEEIASKSHQIEVVSRHKSEFVASMSHELRTPLNAIIGFSQVLADKLFGELNAKQEEYVQDIVDSGRHLLSLINDVLDLSKVESGRMELEPSTFSLLEALEDGLTMIRERASQHAIRLSLQVEPGIGLVEADERKIKQVILNLVSNAVKFTPDNGEVELLARQLDDEIRVSVRDTGIGIALEDQARIFEDFQQLGLHTREGTGLGLALSRRFVELHGGRLWVESLVGHGSTFTFSLPLRPAAAKPPLAAAGRSRWLAS